MKHVELLPWILFGTAFMIAIIAAIALVAMKRDDQTDIKDEDYQNAERPFIDKH